MSNSSDNGGEEDTPGFIAVGGCREHNLKSISLRIPLRRLTLVCGVSGSGKSTLARDVLYREGQGRFLESFPAYARLFQSRLGRSRSDSVSDIPPALALGQDLSLGNPRSTVATLTGLLGSLRMLYSRFAAPEAGGRLTRSHLSFNHPLGACPRCQGLGQVLEIDVAGLVEDERRTLRQGVLRLSTPNGYIIYSQVTIDVLDEVCRAHGFSVDVPWRDLSDEQRRVVLYGSDRVRIPFGKHPLSSRLRWTGITPKPRELGTYRGIVPIMEEILRRGPNPGILRFCRREPCRECGGLRLAAAALEASYQGTPLRRLLALTVAGLAAWTEGAAARPGLSRPERMLLADLAAHARLLQELSLGHLALRRAVPTLSRSEGQRIRVAGLLRAPISGMLYVLDEPGSGLHPQEKTRLYRRFRELTADGSTVILVSHDRQALAFADWVVELGPVGGAAGGHLLFCGDAALYASVDTPTLRSWKRPPEPAAAPPAPPSLLEIGPVRGDALEFARLEFPCRSLVGISGLSGSGKSTLLGWLEANGPAVVRGGEKLRRVVAVDPQPLGRNSRSNPATYTKLFDDIRRLFAAQPRARELGLNASAFSFNSDRGCCPACLGAGEIEITMHYLQSLSQSCPQCQGRRYQDRVLEVRCQGLAIDEVLALTVDQAGELFAREGRIAARLRVLSRLGLGYLTLGQPSSTLSGGEAQRVRLASFIQQGRAAGVLYLLDEPCMGLHDLDIACLARALQELRDQGATLLVAENNPRFLSLCDWLIELPPPGIAAPPLAGDAAAIRSQPGSTIASLIRGDLPGAEAAGTAPEAGPPAPREIRMLGVRTHNLKDVSVVIPENRFTVIGGPSGAGKSSLALETLYKACLRRYAGHLSPYLRDRLAPSGEGEHDAIAPLKPAVALAARYLEATPRSTVGTLSGLNDLLRVLFSRAGEGDTPPGSARLHASHFSFNHQDGACPSCGGLGTVLQADATRWLVHPERAILDGAFSVDKACQFFLDPQGRHMAVLQGAAQELALDIRPAWRDLTAEAQRMILDGAEGEFAVAWSFRRGERRGEHRFTSSWIGLNRLVLQDHRRRLGHRRQAGRYDAVVGHATCPACGGLRLRELALRCRLGAATLGEMLATPLARLQGMFSHDGEALFPVGAPPRQQLVCREVMPALDRQLRTLLRLGLGYLTLARGADTLSSGEHQRLRLSSLLANRLNFTLFVLDEISRGLHPHDVANLVSILRGLLRGGNTIVAVDHHPLVAAQADWTIRLGPGGGQRGGAVTFMGRETAAAAAGMEIREAADMDKARGVIAVSAARIHNLDGLDLAIPPRGLTVLSGVSGSGKSTLMHRVIHESARAGRPVHCAALEGLERFAQVLSFAPLNPRRCGGERVIDFLGAAPAVFKAFAQAADPAGRRHLYKALASPDTASACPHCQGAGEWTAELDYMGSFTEGCSHCLGSGLAIELAGLSLGSLKLAEALAGDIDALPGEVVAACGLQRGVRGLAELSLGYLSLGRRLRTLSTGELQRLRLARLLLDLGKEPCLLLLDEPDSGLSPEECRELIAAVRERLAHGHAAVVISHQPLTMGQADHIIDLGPGAGEDGGRVVASGTPRQVVEGDWPLSKTAAFLRQMRENGSTL
ncbi:MAG TPA: AAA family ATPase [Candidatus Aminicenantes bacterium]|nr:AAA family ATPase [Candidatus Aminicenantes bacterium]